LTIQWRLLSINIHKAQLIVLLFASPQSLKEGSLWAPLLLKLERKLCTLLLVVDEAQTVPLHGRSFRRLFIEMCKGVLKYVFQANPSLRVLAMYASFCLEEQAKFASIISVQPTEIMWGSIAHGSAQYYIRCLCFGCHYWVYQQ
jgi:hypothetical protein